MACLICRQRKAKCDNVRPVCGPCSKFQRSCQYAERERKRGPKKRSLKQLEDRLLSFERKLNQGDVKASDDDRPLSAGLRMPESPDPSQLRPTLDMPISLHDQTAASHGLDAVPLDPTLLDDGFSKFFGPGLDLFSWDLDANYDGLEAYADPMPPKETTDELTRFFFERVYLHCPLIHEERYLANESSYPPCLRYAIWALGAELSRSHRQQSDIYYRRARACLEADELKGSGESYLTLAHAQTWALITMYETLRQYYPRVGMSSRRATALATMLGLDRLDADDSGKKRILPHTTDPIEMEQRRRTFWVAFCNDRWASSANGWSLSISADEIETNLPCSEAAFSQGRPEQTASFREALKKGLSDDAPPYAAMMLIAQIIGENMLHLNYLKTRKDRKAEAIWDEHHQIDNALSKTFLSLPDHLRAVSGPIDQTIMQINMTLHASVISLHQATLQMIGQENIDQTTWQRCQNRCFVTACEIANMSRMSSHLGAEHMHLFVTYPLYMAAHVFLNANLAYFPEKRVSQNLELVYAIFHRVQGYHASARPMYKQLRARIEKTQFSYLLEETNASIHQHPGEDETPDTITHTYPRMLRLVNETSKQQ